MRKFLHSRLLLIPSVLLLMAALVGLAQGYSALHPASARAASTHKAIDCSQTRTCADARVEDETYVGHDEPSALFYSNKPGSGTRMQYHLSLPKDPPAQPTQADGTVSTNFQLHPAFWFGMAMCATQSAPNPGLPCTPDSDNNITDAVHHPGAAFTELQFYPPGWVQWPNIAGSCDPTRWCAALNIDSVAVDQIHGTTLNIPCAQFIFAPTFEYVNFAFVTKNGHSLAPANPVDSTLATFTPDAARTLFMNSGDQLVVTLRDSEHGLRVEITDLTTHQSGLMTASAENGFGQVKYAPAPSTECTNIPYDFLRCTAPLQSRQMCPGRSIPTISPSLMRSVTGIIAALCLRMVALARAMRARAATRNRQMRITPSALARRLPAVSIPIQGLMEFPISKSGLMEIRRITQRLSSLPVR